MEGKTMKSFIRFLISLGLLISFNSFAAPSGDSVVDAWIAPYAYKFGNSAAPTFINPPLYTNGYLLCNSMNATAWESTCPSDLTFTPNANTGGYQGFGVGLTNYPAGGYYVAVCYYVFYYDSSGEVWSVAPVCDWYSVSWPDVALGTVAGRIEFGTGLSIYNSTWGNVPASTLAFKANSVYTPTAAVYCDPDINVSTLDAPCDASQQNVYAVPEAGYEDKILIQDYSCTVTVRTNGNSDAIAGCLTHDSYWYSDLPGAYRDSVLLDGPNYYVSASGSVDKGLDVTRCYYAYV
jgi:hypothetical protein